MSTWVPSFLKTATRQSQSRRRTHGLQCHVLCVCPCTPLLPIFSFPSHSSWIFFKSSQLLIFIYCTNGFMPGKDEKSYIMHPCMHELCVLQREPISFLTLRTISWKASKPRLFKTPDHMKCLFLKIQRRFLFKKSSLELSALVILGNHLGVL